MYHPIQEKKRCLVIGMMSGTSADGIDAALIQIDRSRQEGVGEAIELLAFQSQSYPPQVREKIFQLFHKEESTVEKIGYMNFLLGELYAKSALDLMKKAGVTPKEVDIIGSHGQTIWHQPQIQEEEGYPIRFTVQIGEGSVIAQRTGIITVSDFRTADMAAGGQGAPLVSFAEHHLYTQKNRPVLLQNIGGIGNMTILKADARREDVFAFDTGPGNMILDAGVKALTGGKMVMDDQGQWAAKGRVSQELLALLQQEGYYREKLPKTTGRELFGEEYTAKILEKQRELGITEEDLLATVTDLTAWSIADAYQRYVAPYLEKARDTTTKEPLLSPLLITAGGGSYNKTLLAFLRKRMEKSGVEVRTQEEMGYSSEAKEAVAFAYMAYKTLAGQPNTLPSVTGASRPVITGKISLP